MKDRISELPDDILIECLSLLEMKNASQTSVLSKRWRYLWTHLTSLDFDADVMYPEQAATFWKYHEYEISRYFGWVNQVVGMHQSPSIHTFRVYSSFVSGYGTQLHKWVKFAFSKQVKELVLNLEGIQMKRTDCPKEGFPLDKRRDAEGGPCIVLKNLPMLVETTFHGGFCIYPFPIFHTLSPFCKQLRKLSLRIEHDYCEELVIPDGVVPIFTQLKHFTCTVDCKDYSCILAMKRFIEACPMLEEFKLQVAFMGGRLREFEEANELRGIVLEDEHENGEAITSEISQFQEAKVENVNEENQTHQNLKILEIVGFLGASCDIQLALAIVSYASSLETIICDPQAVRYSGTAYPFFNDSWRECDVAKSKRRARKLSKLVAPKVKVVII